MSITEERKIYLEKVGLTPSDVSKWRVKLENLKSSAKNYGRVCTLTFEEYVDLAVQAKIKRPSQIGNKIRSYQMGRNGDVGNYEKGNCRFITAKQNYKERTLNGGTARGAEKRVANLSSRKLMGN